MNQQSYQQINFQQQQQQQQNQYPFPMGEPNMERLSSHYSQIKQETFQSGVLFHQKKLDISFQDNYFKITISNAEQNRNNQSLQADNFLNEEDKLTIIYGDRSLKINLDKSYIENRFQTIIQYNTLDISYLRENITAEDFNLFIEFFTSGILIVRQPKIATYVYLFLMFQLHQEVNSFINHILQNSENNVQILSSTAKFDDILLYNLASIYTNSNKNSDQYLKALQFTQQWYMINQRKCWFFSNKISNLICLFKEQQIFENFCETNLYIQERLLHFLEKSVQPEIDHDIIRIMVIMHEIIQTFYCYSAIKINNIEVIDIENQHQILAEIRTQNVNQQFATFFPIINMSPNLFFMMKDFYDQQLINDKLVHINQQKQQEIEQHRIELLTLKMILSNAKAQ